MKWLKIIVFKVSLNGQATISANANTIIKKLCKAQGPFLIRILRPTDIWYFYKKTQCNINSERGKELVSKGLWWKG